MRENGGSVERKGRNAFWNVENIRAMEESLRDHALEVEGSGSPERKALPVKMSDAGLTAFPNHGNVTQGL